MTTFVHHSVRKGRCSPKNRKNDLFGKIFRSKGGGLQPNNPPPKPPMLFASQFDCFKDKLRWNYGRSDLTTTEILFNRKLLLIIAVYYTKLHEVGIRSHKKVLQMFLIRPFALRRKLQGVLTVTKQQSTCPLPPRVNPLTPLVTRACLVQITVGKSARCLW